LWQNIKTMLSYHKKIYLFCLALLVSMYVAGFIGLQLEVSRPLFEQLVPFNLWMTASILLLFHQDWRKSFWFFISFTFLMGFAIEVVGVKTQAIFGDYQYLGTLGFKLWEVPVIIGLNWFVLIYITGCMAERWKTALIWKIFLAAGLMVFLDFFIEPVAIKHHFWVWQSGNIPLQNYMAWFVVSIPLHFLFFKSSFLKYNSLATHLYAIQLVFFMGLSVIYLLD
jgi:uncharacterized membrane protein